MTASDPAPKRRFGQHFLTNATLLDRIVDAVAPSPGALVLEIGPGRGSLTEALRRRGARVVAIEIDRDLAAGLRSRFDPDQVRVVEGDALALDWRVALGRLPPEGFLLAGNIPYRITTPLLEKALTPPPPRARRIVFLVQREVADRLAAAPGTRAYGALTVGVGVGAEVERLFRIPAGAFTPPPRVESVVIRLTPRHRPLVPDQSLHSFRRLVTGLFGFRRKQLGRALRELTGWPPPEVAALVGRQRLDPTIRPERLGLDAFVALHTALVDAGWRVG